jgi:hypothetical protein
MCFNHKVSFLSVKRLAMKSTVKNKQDRIKQIQQDIEGTLLSLPIVRNRGFRWLFDTVPVAVVASTTVMTFAGLYTRVGVDLLYLTGGLAILISILVTRTLFEQFPHILLMLWRRKLLCPRDTHAAFAEPRSQTIDMVFLRFIRAIPESMNSKAEIIFGMSGILIAGWTIWLLDTDILREIYVNFRTHLLWYSILLLVRLSFIAAGFVAGIIGWRIMVIADTISKLGKTFDFDIQINHPDGCGGLRPIGDLCLKLAYVISPLPILLGLWLVFINFFDLRYLRMVPENLVPLGSTLVLLAIPTAALCLFSFFMPLGTVHTAMLRAKSKLQIELDDISQEIHQLSTDLLTKANSLAPQQGIPLEEKIEFLKRVYARNSQIPTWPYRSTHIWGLISTQIVPSLGVISSIVGFIQGFRR